MSRRPTSRDVAEAAGVSRTAVSLVLNDRADGEIDPAKQARIRQVAADLGYIPNSAAVNLRKRNTSTIGLVTDEIASAPFAGPLIDGATTAAMQSGYMVLTIDTAFHDDYITGAIDTLRSRNVDGIVFAAASVREVDIPDNARTLPFVLANALDSAGEMNAFIPDDRGGERLAVQLALDAGHTRIGLVSGDEDAMATVERREGFRDQLTEAGIAVDERLIFRGGYSMRSHYELGMEILRRPERPTALLCANDRGAAGMYLAAATLGLSIPEDLSVIGFDDEQFFANDLSPALTTIALPHREMGAAAVTELIAGIRDRERPSGVLTRLSCEAIQRASLRLI